MRAKKLINRTNPWLLQPEKMAGFKICLRAYCIYDIDAFL